MASMSMAFKLLGQDISASKAFKGVGKTADATGKRVQGMGVAAGVGLAAMGAAAIAFAGDAVSKATDLGETTSKVGVLFGDSAGEIESWASTAATALGQSKQQAMDAAATFATIGKGAGLAGNDLTGFSKDMTGLASDLASFSNTSPEEAITAISAAMRGESEPIRKYGVMLDDATLRNEALALGLIKTTKDALTPQQKALAAQAAIMKQTTAAQGDFSRTSGGLANQQRIMQAQFDNASAAVGQGLLPVLTTLATFATTTLIPVLSGMATWIGQNTDWLLPLAAGIAIIVGAIKTWTIVQAALNIVMSLNPIGLVVIAIAALVAGLVIAYQRSETFRNIVQGAWTGIKAAAEAVVGWFRDTAWPMLKKVIDFIIGYYKLLWTAFKLVAGWIGEKVGEVVGVFTGMADSIYGAFKTVFNGIASLWNSTVGRLSFGVPDWVPGMGGKGFDVPDIPMLANGGIVRSPTLALIGEGKHAEAVIPLDGRHGFGGPQVVIEVHGNVVGPGAGKWLAAEIAKAQGVGRVPRTA